MELNSPPRSLFGLYLLLVGLMVTLVMVYSYDQRNRECSEEDLFYCSAEMRATMGYICDRGKHIRGWSDLDKTRFAWGRIMHRNKACSYCGSEARERFPEIFRCEGH